MSDHSVFSWSSTRSVIVLIIFVDDIIISGSDYVGIVDLKAYISRQFHAKNLGTLQYFLESRFFNLRWVCRITSMF